MNRDWMDWALDQEWGCEFCGKRCLLWTLRHGWCLCDECGALYAMRDGENEETVLTTPKCILKDYAQEALRKAWPDKGFDEITEAEFEAAKAGASSVTIRAER